ncbi:HMG-Y-related protein A [Cardamine amara subsp. amara]|uniref:HMG-Y-related protein A n=1 Tax=Cardamine amara subsp. amara TaxID=228776 RepID=A0ABD0ZY40_CARAN
MAASTTLVSMAPERKVENLRAFMVNLANSRGFLLPGTKLFEQKFLDLCLSRIPDHPTYSAMIFVAIMDLKEEGGSCEEAISEFIKLKYKNLPFAHKSLLSHHLANLVEKREILCDCNNYCYSLPGEKKTVASTDSERKSAVITVRTNDQRAANEVMTLPNEEESVRTLKYTDYKVDLLEEQSLTEYGTSPRREACYSISVIEVRHTEDNGVNEGLRDSTVETLRKEGIAEEPEVILGNSETESRIGANIEEGELYEVVVLDEQNDVLMEESGKEVMETSSKHRKAKLCRTSNTMKEACVEVNSEAYKRLWECQTEACSNIIALEKMLKHCREKDQQNKTVSEIDDVSHLPLSMESCKDLWKVAQKIQSQLSEIIDSCDEAIVPYSESQGCEIEGISNGFVKEDPNMKTPCENNGSDIASKQLEQKEIEIGSQKKPQIKKTRMKRLRDIATPPVRKSPRFRL